MEINQLTSLIIGAALRVHSALGPGLFESVYEVVLARDLTRAGLLVERQKAVPFEFEGMRFEEGYRLDLLVENCVVVEVKSVSDLAQIHTQQLLTYLRLSKCPVGLLFNFGATHLRDGIRRVANDPSLLRPSAIRPSRPPLLQNLREK